MSIPQQFSKGVAWMAAGSWAEQAVNFLVFVVLARLLGAEAFGLLAMAAALVILCEFLVRESLSEVLISSADPTEAQFNAVFWLLMALGLGLTVILAAVSGPVARFYGEPQVAGLVLALSPTVLMIAPTAVPVAILRRALRFRTLSLRALAGVIAGGVVGIGMAVTGFGVWSLAGQRLAQVGTNIAMAWFAVGWRPGLRFSRADLGGVLGFGSSVLALRVAELAAVQMPTVLIGAALGPVQLGLYSVAWRLVEIGSFLIVTPLRMAAQPAFAAMTRAGDRAAGLLIDVASLSGMLAFPAFLGLAVLARPVLGLVFGPDWVGAAPALAALSLVGAYLCIEKLHQVFCLAAGRAGAISALAWAEVLLGAALIWIAARWGLGAVALAFSATFYLIWPLRFGVVARVAGVQAGHLAALHLRPLVAALVMALAVWGVVQAMGGAAAWLVVAVGFAVGVAVFGGLTAVFMRDRVRLLRHYARRG